MNAPTTMMIVMLALPVSCEAQAVASERGTVSQVVDGTTIAIDYGRPVARGRTLFGRVVRWGETWTPGANGATTIDIDRDVRVEGKALPKRKYAIWTIPQQDEWTIIFSKNARAFHTQRPRADDEQMRVTVKSEQGPHTEMLTWGFPTVFRDGTTLRLQWGTTTVPLPIAVTQSRPIPLSAETLASYAGKYVVTFATGAGPSTALHVDVAEATGVAGTIRLRGANDTELDLTAIGENEFHPAFYRRGTLIDIEPSDKLTFRMEGARAAGFEIRDELGKVIATGAREK